jgi:hypothetical protein
MSVNIQMIVTNQKYTVNGKLIQKSPLGWYIEIPFTTAEIEAWELYKKIQIEKLTADRWLDETIYNI